MSQPEHIEETMPSKPQKADRGENEQVTQPLSPSGAPASGPQRPKRWRWILGGLALFVVLAGLGALGGYQSAVSARQSEQDLQSAVEANYQYQLGVADLQNGDCARAKDRFVYVIQLVPDFPGAQDQLIAASVCASGSSAQSGDTTESGVPTPGPTPTPDLRGAEAVLADARNQVAAKNWDALLPLLDTLRKNFPDYEPIQVDDMYYLGYRNRGVDRIGQGDLEPGIFDLNNAQKIGPLDNDALYWSTEAVNYLIGLSFWEVDWSKAYAYFQGVGAEAPSLHDLNFISAADRLATASVSYAQQLLEDAAHDASFKNWCTAQDKMQQSSAISPLSEENQAELDRVTQNCIENGNENP